MHHLTGKEQLCSINLNTLYVHQVKQRLSEFFYPDIAHIMIGLFGLLETITSRVIDRHDSKCENL